MNTIHLYPAAVISKIKNKNTLIISDEHSISKDGTLINFVIKEGRQKFKIRKNIQQHGLNVDSKLLSPGTNI